MDFPLPDTATARRGSGREAIVLCCKSEGYFGPHLERVGAKPLLATTQFMYPGGFILAAALDGWLAGGNARANPPARRSRLREEPENQRESRSRGVFRG